jgi:hypothetical protein
MGLLDEAIREHLDLKRRRGADPNEVERLEQEALGPVRRGARTSEEDVPSEDVLDHQDGESAVFDDQAEGPYTEVMQPEAVTGAYLDEQDPDLAEPLREEPAIADGPAFHDEAMHEPFPEDESEKGWTHEPTEAWQPEEPLAPEDPAAPAAETPAPAAPPPASRTPPPAPAEPVREADHPGEETVEYDVEAEEIRQRRGDAKERTDEDVLEETPEFLQDTPDHDRLWFEQRPPKDFDFDK